MTNKLRLLDGDAAEFEKRLARLEKRVEQGRTPRASGLRIMGELCMLRDDDPVRVNQRERAYKVISNLRAQAREKMGDKWDVHLHKQIMRSYARPKEGKYADLLVELEKRVQRGKVPDQSDFKLIREVWRLPEENPERGMLWAKASKILTELKNRDLERLLKKWDRDMAARMWKEVEKGEYGILGRMSRRISNLLHEMKPRPETEEAKARAYAKEQESRIVSVETPKVQETLQQDLAAAEASVASYANAAARVVGYNKIRNRIIAAAEYHVIQDDQFRTAHAKYPPPQVFILKGSSGMGKTALVQSIMYEITMKRGKPRNVPIRAKAAGLHEFGTKYYGESPRMVAGLFEDAYTKPSILFVDEIQAITNRNTDSGGADGNYGTQTDQKVQDTILQKINELEGKQCVLILATDDFNSLPTPLKRRGTAGTLDLDDEMRRADLIEITKRELDRNAINNVKPEDVLEVLESKFHSLGHKSVTPADIINSVKGVVDVKLNPILEKSLENISSASSAALPVQIEASLDDFKRLNKTKEYAEEQKSKEVQNLVTRIRPKNTLSDVGGLPVKNKLYTDIAAAMDYENTRLQGATPIKGILLYGTPGTGKTWLAMALAGEAGATVYMVRGAEMMKPHFGESEKIIKDLLAEARKNEPSIIVIDEIDAITQNRDSQNVNRGAVSTLLAEMGGSTPMNGVVIIGTTNKIDHVDPAFRRPGRFDRVVEISPPKNKAERIEVIKIHLDKCRAFIDSSVTEENILELFGKRTLIPANIERMISDAVQLRMKELKAAAALTKAPNDDLVKLNKLMGIYGEELERLYSNLAIAAKPPASIKEMPQAVYESLGHLNPADYKLNISHFRAALDMIRDENIEMVRKFSVNLRGPNPQAAVGTVYGLFAMPDNASGGLAGQGGVGVIECIPHVLEKDKQGAAHVEGSEVDESIKSSARHAWFFLNDQSDWALKNYDFHIEFVSIMKGMDQKGVSGPSAGAAIALAEYSAATNQEVLPNIVVTGAITQRGALTIVGGLDSNGMGKFLAAASEPGVNKIVIPRANYDQLPEEDRKAIEKQGLEIIPASNFWEVANIMLASHPDERQARALLKNVLRQKEYLRTE